MTAMTQVDRYLETVGMFLPDRQKDDILNELSDAIRSRIEDMEAELGRPLSDAEQSDVLKTYGHPMSVASRYRPDTGGRLVFGKELIGPALFPLYVRVLGISLLIALAVQIVLTITLQLPNDSTFSRLVVQAVMQSAAVTAIFALIQRAAKESPERWEWLTGASAAIAPTSKQLRISRLESAVQIVLMTIFIIITNRVLLDPEAGIGPFRLAPIWHTLYWPFIVVMAAGIVQSAISFVKPDWVRLQAATQVGFEVVSLTLIGLLLAAGSWVTLVAPAAATAAEAQKLAEIAVYMDQFFLIGLVISVAISIYQLVQNVRRYRRLSR